MPSKPPALKQARQRKPWTRAPNKPDTRIRGRKGQEMRKRRLAAEPLCRICKIEGRVTAPTVPDHILPLAKGGEDIDSNIRCLCGECHDRVTREEFGLRKQTAIGDDGWPT